MSFLKRTGRKHRARVERRAERDAARAKRTDDQQIGKLQAAGHGHCREVKRLQNG